LLHCFKLGIIDIYLGFYCVWVSVFNPLFWYLRAVAPFFETNLKAQKSAASLRETGIPQRRLAAPLPQQSIV
jgi:hypothetical protein